MPSKTDRLVALFPDAYAAREGGSLLHRVLDALGNELEHADDAIKSLLKSHWIDYAEGGGLDGLGALFGIARRVLPDGSLEDDDSFRLLVRATVPSFIGGGTVEAIKGAVRAALGLPYDLALLQRQLAGAAASSPARLTKLIEGLKGLVQVIEFSPKTEIVLGSAAPATGGSKATLNLNFTTVQPVPPRIEWTFPSGGARHLSVIRQDTGAGIKSKVRFAVPSGATLVLSGTDAASFSASIGTSDVTGSFVGIDGSSPPALPPVPAGASIWMFAAAGAGEFDLSAFDSGEAFDAVAFTVQMEWTRYQPLLFDVIVPYFVDAAVKRILDGTGYERRIKVFKGLSLDAIQKVVDANRAAGVRGMVQYSLSLPGESQERALWEDHKVAESFGALIASYRSEQHDVDEALSVGALNSVVEAHDADERFAIGTNFNVAVFDGSFGFQ